MFVTSIFSFPHNDKILDWSILKTFTDDKIKFAKIKRFLSFTGLKILWEKEKMLVTSILSSSHNVLYRFFFLLRVALKVRIVWQRVRQLFCNGFTVFWEKETISFTLILFLFTQYLHSFTLHTVKFVDCRCYHFGQV